MFECKMYWDGIVNYYGHLEVRSGIRIIKANNKEEVINHAYNFFNNEAFVEYDALLENEDFIFIIESK